MKEMCENCKFCGNEFCYYKTNNKNSNGSWVKYYKDMTKMASLQCKHCKNSKLRELRKLNKNKYTHKYEKTKKGFLVRVYRNMKSRVEGIQKKKAHLYLNKEILDKKSFYDWSLNDDTFLKLWCAWKESEHCRKLTPSIDRIDSSKGYILQNMRWLTHSENSRLGSLSKNKKH